MCPDRIVMTVSYNAVELYFCVSHSVFFHPSLFKKNDIVLILFIFFSQVFVAVGIVGLLFYTFSITTAKKIGLKD